MIWPHADRAETPEGVAPEMTIADDPIVVADALRKSRSVAFASDYGPRWALPGFVEWESYAPAWRQMPGWTACRS
jgi:uncharacterized membrane protein